MAEVRAEKLLKVFRNRQEAVRAVNEVDVLIPDHEFAVFVGPSGSGKTTFLRLVAGLEVPTGGKLFIGERDVTTLHPRERGIAMVFQDYALYPHMTVAQNMSFALENLGYPREEIQTRVVETARMLQIDALLGRKPRQLSGGQRQRVALGRAIVRKPAVFLFDEPLSNLDAKLRAEMRLELSELHAELQTTAIYVTHDQVEALTLGDRIFVMNDGRVQQIGTGAEVYDAPANAFVASFIGTPQINLVKAQVAQCEQGLAVSIDGQQLPVPQEQQQRVAPWVGREVFLGIRPEHLDLEPPVADGSALSATVRIVEHLGPELLVHLDVSGSPLVARVPVQTPVRSGETRIVGVNMRAVHLFDTAGDQPRITAPTTS
jgi:ABC-type sugar transport system ATPase subunit